MQRLAGDADWKEPIQLGTEIVREYGGPESYLLTGESATSPSRRFLLEQMTCQEIICEFPQAWHHNPKHELNGARVAAFLSLEPLKLDRPESTWMERPPSEKLERDHIEVVYGMDR